MLTFQDEALDFGDGEVAFEAEEAG